MDPITDCFVCPKPGPELPTAYIDISSMIWGDV